MSKFITVSFAATAEQKTCLEQWAQQDDRSVSYILRDILKRELDRRAAQAQTPQQPKQSH